MQCIPGLSRG